MYIPKIVTMHPPDLHYSLRVTMLGQIYWFFFFFIESLLRAVIGVSVALGPLCLGLFIVVIIFAIVCYEKKKLNSASPTQRIKTPQVYKSDCIHYNINFFSRVEDHV